MKICELCELLHRNFNLVFINALRQSWHKTKSFQCIGNPKNENLLLFLEGCKITYTDKFGRTLTATDGDIIYTPLGSEYRAQMSDFKSESSHTVGINFLLFDEDGEPVILSDGIQIFRNSHNQALSMLFHRTLGYDVTESLTQNRILLFEILSHLSPCPSKKYVPDYLENTLQYLSEHLEENPTVRELAGRCNISEVYFRKQFKKYLDTTPFEYRKSLRLGRALAYLEYGDISVQEISDTLGFSSVSHFIKEFKFQYGCSPLKYRKLNRMDIKHTQ